LNLPPCRFSAIIPRKKKIFTDTDGYGHPLTFTMPSDLRNLRLPDDLAVWNWAILAFLHALPQDTRVILYWS